MLERLHQQVGARVEVVMDQRARDARLVCDRAHAQAVGTLPRDHAAGRFEDLELAIGHDVHQQPVQD